MAAITAQEIESNLLSLPEEERTIAVSAMEKLNDTELVTVLKAFGVDVDPEQFTEQPAMQEAMPEQPVMPEQTPMDQQMEQLAPGGTPEVSGETLKQMAGLLNVPGKGNSGVDDDIESEMTGGDGETGGSFVINKAAADFTGFSDIKGMLENAKKEAIELGFSEAEDIDVGIIVGVKKADGQEEPTDTDVAVSNGEVIIPEVLAKVIGYDRLEKMNKRGNAQQKTEEKLADKQEPAMDQEVPVRAANGDRIEVDVEVPQTNEQELINSLVDQLIKDEGFIPEARKPTDSRDRLTIGHGRTKGVKVGDTTTPEKARVMLVEDIRERLPKIRKQIKPFNSLPLDIQIPIFSEFFRGSLTATGSKDTVRLINQARYGEAAKEYLKHEEYKKAVARRRPGIRGRMERARDAIAKIRLPPSEPQLREMEKMEEKRGGETRILFDTFDSE